MYIFLDESGDLGFDFTKPGTSRFFVITMLLLEHPDLVKNTISAIKRTYKHKINAKKKSLSLSEIKGTQTSIGAKTYFHKKLGQFEKWSLHTIVVDKHSFIIPKHINDTHSLYDWFSGKLIREIPIIVDTIYMVVDKSKTESEIVNFNRFLEGIIFERSNGKTNIIISHEKSYDEKPLQAVDLYCHGIYSKHENNDSSWFDVFKNRLLTEILL